LDDCIDYIIGWRAWRVRDVRLPGFDHPPLRRHVGAYRLASLRTNDPRAWAPLQPTRAICSGQRQCEDSPDEGCSCGFYAYRSLPHLLVSLSARRDYDAIGEVGLGQGSRC
jgi:hypothetical protein